MLMYRTRYPALPKHWKRHHQATPAVHPRAAVGIPEEHRRRAGTVGLVSRAHVCNAAADGFDYGGGHGEGSLRGALMHIDLKRARDDIRRRGQNLVFDAQRHIQVQSPPPS